MMEEPPESRNKGSSGRSAGQAQSERGGNGRIDAAPNPVFSRAHDFSSIVTLGIFTLLGSALIIVMVVVVNTFSTHRKQADVVETAALLAARELTQITVENPSFGRVGLCDMQPEHFSAHEPGGTVGSIGIATLYETLRIDREIANKLGQPSIKLMAERDTQLARKVERELALKLKEAVQADTAQTAVVAPGGADTGDQDNVVYRDVYRIISSDREAQAASSVELKIYLGRATSTIFSREETHLVNENQFVANDRDHAPYLVLLDVRYEEKQRGSANVQAVVKRACALVGAPPIEAAPSAFVLNFPQGVPPQFKSAYDVLFYRHWEGKGDWQQAVGSEVPGKGSLAPPLDPIMPEMNPSDAMAVGIYHWLKSAGTGVDPDLAVELIKSSWNLDALQMKADKKQSDQFESGAQQEQATVNSCLARDTGAREYSIMNQTGPASTGQTALCRAFAVFDPSAPQGCVYPESALPLYVDVKGNCNLAGRNGFHADLIRSLLKDVHDTNIAAVATLAVSKQFLTQSLSALNQTEQRIFIEKQELSSVSSRLARLNEEASRRAAASKKEQENVDEETANKLILTQERANALRLSIATDEQRNNELLEAHKLATMAIANSNRAASATFELWAHAFKSCRDGIYKIDSPEPGYLIGRKYLFYPRTEQVTENDFLANLDQGGKGSSQKREPKSLWFRQNVETVVPLEPAFGGQVDKVMSEGKTLKEILQSKPVDQVFRSGMIVLDSRSIARSSTGTPTCRGYRQYAFSNIAIPSGQLLYYCQNAVKSGAAPQVAWSVLLRDLVATRSTASETGSTGNPIPSQERQWCSDTDNGQCPGLACELQIRSPLPILTNLDEDTYLKEPALNAQIPQIPPVPADML